MTVGKQRVAALEGEGWEPRQPARTPTPQVLPTPAQPSAQVCSLPQAGVLAVQQVPDNTLVDGWVGEDGCCEGTCLDCPPVGDEIGVWGQGLGACRTSDLSAQLAGGRPS